MLIPLGNGGGHKLNPTDMEEVLVADVPTGRPNRERERKNESRLLRGPSLSLYIRLELLVRGKFGLEKRKS